MARKINNRMLGGGMNECRCAARKGKSVTLLLRRLIIVDIALSIALARSFQRAHTVIMSN